MVLLLLIFELLSYVTALRIKLATVYIVPKNKT